MCPLSTIRGLNVACGVVQNRIKKMPRQGALRACSPPKVAQPGHNFFLAASPVCAYLCWPGTRTTPGRKLACAVWALRWCSTPKKGFKRTVGGWVLRFIFRGTLGDSQLNNSISKQGEFANSSDCSRPDVAQRPTNLVLIACQGKGKLHSHIFAYMPSTTMHICIYVAAKTRRRM